MNRKRLLIGFGTMVGSLLLLIVIVVVGLSVAGNRRLNEIYEVEPAHITVPTDEAALARGGHLVQVTCTECHGADLSGGPMLDDPAIGTVYAPNISGGADRHSVEELVLAIRHGLDHDRRPLLIMPAESFVFLSESDLGAIIGYLNTVPASGEPTPARSMGPVGRMLIGANILTSAMPATYLDHEQPFPDMPEIGANLVYGEYVSRLCQACHGPDLAGAQPADPDSVPAPNLTPGGELGGWTEADFFAAIRTGATPTGRSLNPAFMPWSSYANFEDDELRGLWLYLAAQPALPSAAE